MSFTGSGRTCDNRPQSALKSRLRLFPSRSTVPLPRRLDGVSVQVEGLDLQLRTVNGENRVHCSKAVLSGRRRAERFEQVQFQRKPIELSIRHINSAVALQTADIGAVPVKVHSRRRFAHHLARRRRNGFVWRIALNRSVMPLLSSHHARATANSTRPSPPTVPP